MRPKEYKITLSDEERESLHTLISMDKGRGPRENLPMRASC